MSPDAAYSHVTAAVMLGFPLSTSRVRASPVHVTTAGDGARRFRMGVMNHPLKKDLRRRVERYGVSITHPVDTWCALSALLTVDELIEIGDHLVRRQNPDAAMSDLAGAVARYAGRHGAKRLREALAEVRPRTDSVTETRLRLSIVRAGLPEPEINGAITDGEGRHIRLSDMVYREYMVFVEYDGEQHRTDAAQYAKDADALDRAIAAGWLPVRVRKAMLRDPDAAVRRVRAALRLRGWPGLPQR